MGRGNADAYSCNVGLQKVIRCDYHHDVFVIAWISSYITVL
jgi:hypothetical protein